VAHHSLSLPWVRRGFLLLALLLVLDYLVLPQIAGTEKALRLLGGVNPWLLAFGIALEAGSLTSYSLLTRSVLPDSPARFSWLLRTDLTGLGVSHLLPGGAATANTLRYRLLHAGGTATEDAVVGIAVQAVLATAVLAAMLWAALVISIPFFGPSPLYVSSAIVGAILLVGVALALLGHGRQDTLASDVLRRLIQRLPSRVRPRVARAAVLAAGSCVSCWPTAAPCAPRPAGQPATGRSMPPRCGCSSPPMGTG
jgi:uncharacterized membrane protein YbhN (UPF0104 family)